ncbi:MAG: hypothetical protein ACOCYP_10995, partial [Planctomycetota bacterium]
MATALSLVLGAPAFAADAFIEDGGMVVMEVENHTGSASGSNEAASSSWTSTTASSGYSGAAALEATPNAGVNAGDSTDGPRLDYTVDFTTTGTYYVWVRMIGSSDTDDSLHAGLDGSPASYGRYGMTDNSGTWHWEHKAGGSTVSIDVDSAGEHTFSIWMREDGTIIDKVVLTTDSGYSPSGTGPAESELSTGTNAAPTADAGADQTVTDTDDSG